MVLTVIFFCSRGEEIFISIERKQLGTTRNISTLGVETFRISNTLYIYIYKDIWSSKFHRSPYLIRQYSLTTISSMKTTLYLSTSVQKALSFAKRRHARRKSTVSSYFLRLTLYTLQRKSVERSCSFIITPRFDTNCLDTSDR